MVLGRRKNLARPLEGTAMERVERSTVTKWRLSRLHLTEMPPPTVASSNLCALAACRQHISDVHGLISGFILKSRVCETVSVHFLPCAVASE
jgi:hypothetical protein